MQSTNGVLVRKVYLLPVARMFPIILDTIGRCAVLIELCIVSSKASLPRAYPWPSPCGRFFPVRWNERLSRSLNQIVCSFHIVCIMQRELNSSPNDLLAGQS